MLGAAASAFYINDAATILPRSVVVKTSAYLAGAAADVLEVKEKGNLGKIFYFLLETYSFNVLKISRLERELRDSRRLY